MRKERCVLRVCARARRYRLTRVETKKKRRKKKSKYKKVVEPRRRFARCRSEWREGFSATRCLSYRSSRPLHSSILYNLRATLVDRPCTCTTRTRVRNTRLILVFFFFFFSVGENNQRCTPCRNVTTTRCRHTLLVRAHDNCAHYSY